MNKDYSRAIPPAWQDMAAVFVALGDEHRHWFRAKFFQQYRLFFRFHAPSKIIVLAWVNDAATKRAYESGDDAYLVFQKMLANGHPPDDWGQLVQEARLHSERLERHAM